MPPPHVVRYDEDDPYLVVAADKGTATFSDIANGLSADYKSIIDSAAAARKDVERSMPGARSFDELQVRSQTGLGSEQGLARVPAASTRIR